MHCDLRELCKTKIMFSSPWANANSWECINETSAMPLSRTLDDIIADRKNGIQPVSNSDDIAALTVKDMTVKYKDLKNTLSQLLQEIDKSEERRKKIESDIDTLKKILLKELYLYDKETMQLLDKAVAKSMEMIAALDIPTKRAVYTNHREILANYQALIKEAQSEHGNSTEHMCSICFDEEPSHVITPCGHVMCGTCKTKMNDGRGRVCHVCRGSIRDIIKFYL